MPRSLPGHAAGLKRLPLLLALLAGPAALAQTQAPDWQMPQAFVQPSGGSYGAAVATDAAGNVFVAGSFSGTVSFGATKLVSAGITDVFVAKWSPANGRFEWAKRLGSTARDEATALVVRGNSLYVAGIFYSPSVAVGGATLTNTNATTPDAFVVKLTDQGSSADFGWAQSIGGAGAEKATTLALNDTGLYVGGSFESSTTTFGSLSLSNTGAPEADGFVARLTDTGHAARFDWAQPISGDGAEEVYSLAVQGASVYAAGNFSGATAFFGNLKLTNLSPTDNSASNDGFLTRLQDAGTTSSFAWAQTIGDVADVVAVNGSNVYVAGKFTSPVIIDGSRQSDMYVLKFTDQGSSGTRVWQQQLVSRGRVNFLTALAVQGNSVAVGGTFDGPTLSVGNQLLTNAGALGTDDLFVALLTDQGSTSSVAWAQRAGGSGDDYADALAFTPNGLYVAGETHPPAQFGPFIVTATGGSSRGFLAALGGTPLAAKGPTGQLPLRLWPNPARTATQLRLPPLPGTTRVTITLHDALGRPVRHDTASLSAAGLNYELPLNGLAPGLYLLGIQADTIQATQRLVVE